MAGLILLACIGVGILAISRAAYAPKYLFFFDNVNFALSIEHFNPGLHQPQPPGYPLFVGCIKLLNLVTHDAHRALLWAGMLGSLAGLALLWIWTWRMFGLTAAYIAAALLLLHPAFWVAGIVNPVRVFLVVVVCATSILGWQTMTSARPTPWFYATAAVLGFSSGFRPESLPLLLPLLLMVGFRRRVRAADWILAGCFLAGSAALWLVPMAFSMGGFAAMRRTFFEYLRDNSTQYTVAFGAPAKSSLATLRKALVWTLGMSAVWIWVLLFVRRRFSQAWSRPKVLAVAAALLPPLAFHCFVHVRDIDQTLISIPATCVVGGVALASVRPRAAMLAALFLALGASYWSFRRPPVPDMTAASKGHIRYMDDWTKSTFAALDAVRSEKNAVVVWHDTVVPWRQLFYYYPDLPMLVLNDNRPFWALHRQTYPVLRDDRNDVLIPHAKQIVLGLSYAQSRQAALWPGAAWKGPLIALPGESNRTFELGGVSVKVSAGATVPGATSR